MSEMIFCPRCHKQCDRCSSCDDTKTIAKQCIDIILKAHEAHIIDRQLDVVEDSIKAIRKKFRLNEL